MSRKKMVEEHIFYWFWPTVITCLIFITKQCQGCGFTRTIPTVTDTVIVQSPNYPQSYANNLRCTWTINVPAGQTTHTNLYVRADILRTQFGSDLLTVGSNIPFSGGSGTSNRGWRISSTQVVIRFTSDQSGSDTGFQLTVRPMEPCGFTRTLTDMSEKVIITSPLYPQNYTSDTDCIWNINGPQGTISLKVSVKAFYTESNYDRLYIGSQWEMHGERHPITYTVSSSYVRIRFSTDSTITNTGFNLTVHAEGGGTQEVANIASCGFNHTLASNIETKEVSSPGYPRQYPPNISCSWWITGVRYTYYPYVEVSIGTFNTEYGKDFLFVDNYPPTSGFYRSGRVFISRGKTVNIRFTSDGQTSASGFLLRIKAASSSGGGCIHNLQIRTVTESLNITSPNFPNDYPNNLKCWWRFSVPARQTTHMAFFVYFHSFYTETDYDKLYVANLSPRSGMMRYGSRSLFINASHSDIRFVTDESVQRSGFKLTITVNQTSTLCGYHTTLAHEAATEDIYSPQYPYNYIANSDCFWTVTAPSSSTHRWLRVSTASIDLELGFDFLQINNFTRMSGNITSPRVWYPNGSTVSIRFTANGVNERRGFHIVVSAVDTPPVECGGRIGGLHKEGIVEWPLPRYRNKTSATCSWHLSDSQHYTIELVLEQFSLRTSIVSDFCSGAQLSVERTVHTPPRTYQICGRQEIEAGWKIYGRNFTINLDSEMADYARRGFRMKYRACLFYKYLTNSTDKISVVSLRYPLTYPRDSHCLWIVYAPASSTTHRWLKATSNFFHTENNDKVNIDDYHSIQGLMLKPAAWYSITKRIYIEFNANNVTEMQGFNFTVTAVTINELCGFNRTLAGIRDTISIVSPRYPLYYITHANCSWDVSTPKGSSTHRWLRMSIESFNSLPDLHFLKIDNFTAISGQITTRRVWYSRNSTAHIRFTSDGTTYGRGFNMSVTATDQLPVVCGGTLLIPENETEIFLQWPPSPPPVTSSAECLWTVSDASRRSIDVKLEEFTLLRSNDSESCNGANVTIQRISPSSKKSYQLCNSTTNAENWREHGQEFKVNFASAVEGLGSRGFKLRFTACGFTSTMSYPTSSLQITSPALFSNFPSNARCIWRVSVLPPLFTLNATVHSFTLGTAIGRIQILNPENLISATTSSAMISTTEFPATSFSPNASNSFTTNAPRNVSTPASNPSENSLNATDHPSTWSTRYLGAEVMVIFQLEGNLSASGLNLTIGGRIKLCSDLNCSHSCKMFNDTPQCTCPNTRGWNLAVDEQTCLDIDECAPEHPTVCHGFVYCINTHGDFICNCTDGYRLSEDGRNCTDRDGGWTQWSSWSECSSQCGVGQQTSVRNCIEPTVEGSGLECLLNDNATRALTEERSRSCIEKECTTIRTTFSTTMMPTPPPGRNGSWSPWSKWSDCNVTCGEGLRNSSRTCTAPVPFGSGLKCLKRNGIDRALLEMKFKECLMPMCQDSNPWYEKEEFMIGVGGLGGLLFLIGIIIIAVRCRLEKLANKVSDGSEKKDGKSKPDKGKENPALDF